MDNIVMQRTFTPPLEEQDFFQMAEETFDCLDLYRAQWRETLMSCDGSRMICCFEAPDAESVRQLSRDDGALDKQVWSGTFHGARDDTLATVVVERDFEEPGSMEELQAREEAAAWCLEQHRVKFLHSLFSMDRKRMVCLYQAPDAESVRRAQETAGMPVSRIWACRHFTPENLEE